MLSRIRKVFTEYKELKYLAYHDLLTGLLNRNWLYKNINLIEFKYVYFIDINDLHRVNEKGHTYGDEFIKDCVNDIANKTKGVLIRYAGDEFILFSNTNDDIKTNKLYSVGLCIISNNINDAIMIADNSMIESKSLWKSESGRAN